ncbi:MAG TPA: hypothetical protein VMP11_00880 [Verrucomicrobiae bacterium]|nr:hypothetical protein [Verrucomicrobiae bacterium]
MKIRAHFPCMALVALIGLTVGLAPQARAQGGLTISFSNITETVKSKTKIIKSTMTTNTTSKYTVSGNVVFANDTTSNTPTFWVLLWIEQPTNLVTYPDGVPIGFPRKEKALKAGKSTKVPVKLAFTNDQAGTYFFLTDTNINVITSVKIPPVAPQ